MRRFCCSSVCIVNGIAKMKKLILLPILFLVFAANLPAKSYKFIAMDRYYNKAVPIDSIVVRDMKSGEDKTYYADSIYLETITSVEDISGNNGFEIYPNPVEDLLNLTLPNPSNSPIIITDISGKIHFKKAIANPKISLNVAGLPTGVYNITYGNRNQRFVKSSATNGSEVSVISSENSYKSLIKENETQSQFDYRFTIYCNGFQPNIFETKALSIDSTITLDIAALPSSFDGKHIRVVLYLDHLVAERVGSHRNSENSSYITNTNFKYIFNDTLVIRGNKCYLEINHIPYDEFYDYYDREILEFEIDTINFTFTHFRLAKEIDDFIASGFDYTNLTDNMILNIKTNLNYDNENYSALEYLDSLDYSLVMNKFEGISQLSGSNDTYHTSYLSYNKANSYIKIEIID